MTLKIKREISIWDLLQCPFAKLNLKSWTTKITIKKGYIQIDKFAEITPIIGLIINLTYYKDPKCYAQEFYSLSPHK